MNGAAYQLLAWAIENRKPLTCVFDGRPREICPIILGMGKEGEAAALV